jgi:uncharacterized protein YdaT
MAKQQHVVPRQDGGWGVKRSNSERASHVTATKADAVKIAREISKNQGAEMLVHNKDGKIGYRNSYGNDPFPPKG